MARAARQDERLANSLLPLLGLALHLLEPVHGLVEVEHCGRARGWTDGQGVTDGGSQPLPLPGPRPASSRVTASP